MTYRFTVRTIISHREETTLCTKSNPEQHDFPLQCSFLSLAFLPSFSLGGIVASIVLLETFLNVALV
jgi:hypothetical protein